MKVYYSIEDVKPLAGSVVAIGIFDGVHVGHKKIIQETCRRARRLGLKSVLVTFDPHPLKVTRPAMNPATLISLGRRLALIGDMGIDIAIVVDFTKETASLRAHEFVETFLVDTLKAREVVVGEDFRFGRGRTGDIRLLKFLGGIYGFKAVPIRTVKVAGRKASSSLIRSLIMKGDLAGAGALLARPVSIFGSVVRGARIGGMVLGYPTANINPYHEAIPPSGVYAVKVRYGGRWYGAVTNIGFRPTIHHMAKEPVIEVHIFGFRKKDIYGKDLRIDFLKRLRPERHFRHKDALIAQIRLDSLRAQKILAFRVRP